MELSRPPPVISPSEEMRSRLRKTQDRDYISHLLRHRRACRMLSASRRRCPSHLCCRGGSATTNEPSCSAAFRGTTLRTLAESGLAPLVGQMKDAQWPAPTLRNAAYEPLTHTCTAPVRTVLYGIVPEPSEVLLGAARGRAPAAVGPGAPLRCTSAPGLGTGRLWTAVGGSRAGQDPVIAQRHLASPPPLPPWISEAPSKPGAGLSAWGWGGTSGVGPHPPGAGVTARPPDDYQLALLHADRSRIPSSVPYDTADRPWTAPYGQRPGAIALHARARRGVASRAATAAAALSTAQGLPQPPSPRQRHLSAGDTESLGAWPTELHRNRVSSCAGLRAGSFKSQSHSSGSRPGTADGDSGGGGGSGGVQGRIAPKRAASSAAVMGGERSVPWGGAATAPEASRAVSASQSGMRRGRAASDGAVHAHTHHRHHIHQHHQQLQQQQLECASGGGTAGSSRGGGCGNAAGHGVCGPGAERSFLASRGSPHSVCGEGSVGSGGGGCAVPKWVLEPKSAGQRPTFLEHSGRRDERRSRT